MAVLLFLAMAVADFGITIYLNTTEYGYLENPTNVQEDNPLAKFFMQQGIGVSIFFFSVQCLIITTIIMYFKPFIAAGISMSATAGHLFGFLSWVGLHIVGGKEGFMMAFVAVLLITPPLVLFLATLLVSAALIFSHICENKSLSRECEQISYI